MKQQTLDLIIDLKKNNQDFEFYPTTKEMIKAVYDDFCLHRKYYYENSYKNIKSFLDIGCGMCNFLTYMTELENEAIAEFNRREKLKRLQAEARGECYREQDWREGWFEYFVMEKSKILIDHLPKDTVILGTDFNQNTLIDKPIDAIFCNPPYSEFEEWTRRIIKEGNCEYIYLVVPERWKEKADKWYNNRPRFDEPDEVTHYCLSYRIICDSLYFNESYSWNGPKIDNGKAQTIIKDLCAVAHNLGFEAKRWDNPECFGTKYYVWLDKEKPLLEFKVYQNGNTHIKLDKEFAKAMNVEVSRLLGWIRNKSDIADEFPDDMAKGAEKYFKANFSISLENQNIKLLGVA